MDQDTLRPDPTAISLPRLPPELWLQICEQLDDVEFLWCAVRLISKDFKAFVDRVFASSLIPSIFCSLSLPRLDPKTGHARYMRPVPGAEITLQCQDPKVDSPIATFKTPTVLRSGESVAELTASGALSKQRLVEAEVWMWFGRQRGKGANIATEKDLRWDEEGKVWLWSVQWEGLVDRYFNAKRAFRRTQRRVVKEDSLTLRLRR
ncbi:hypothetical protein BU23DRAFT_446571 [Bimuria novae-zelandiae CBS 107.79]|uniref:F-box domain-containing protein n=1 Tax=Bimuria novae-zelandiae CBS 107.79 TaxID=1447943 RepID=A0A6A5VQZ5_9PLEO|nr:hypothetical protein BU23DRAFT_446571 [Bimuria novae-zelandiae CBS 107.79]